MRVSTLIIAALVVGAVVLTNHPADARATVQNYDAVDHVDCTWGPSGPTCLVTGVDCLPVCFTGFCCHL